MYSPPAPLPPPCGALPCLTSDARRRPYAPQPSTTDWKNQATACLSRARNPDRRPRPGKGSVRTAWIVATITTTTTLCHDAHHHDKHPSQSQQKIVKKKPVSEDISDDERDSIVKVMEDVVPQLTEDGWNELIDVRMHARGVRASVRSRAVGRLVERVHEWYTSFVGGWVVSMGGTPMPTRLLGPTFLTLTTLVQSYTVPGFGYGQWLPGVRRARRHQLEHFTEVPHHSLLP